MRAADPKGGLILDRQGATRDHAASGRRAALSGGVRGLFGDAAPGDRSARARFAIFILAALLAAAILFSLASGASDASALAVLADWLSPGASDALSERNRIIISEIRLPRVVLGVLVGAALAVSGAVMQGLFRNPLADPGIVGVSSRRQPGRGVGHRARRNRACAACPILGALCTAGRRVFAAG